MFTNQRFDVALTNGEDWLVLSSVVAQSESIKFISAPLYLYRRTNEGSITHSLCFESIYSSVIALNKIYSFLNSAGIQVDNTCYSKAKYDLGYMFSAGVLLKTLRINGEQIETFYRELNLNLSEIVRGGISLKRKMVLSLLGTAIGRVVLRLW